MTFEVVDRPNRGGGKVSEEFIKSLTETLHNGKALKVQLDSHQHFITWQAGVRSRVKQDGLKLRARFDKVSKKVTCWVEHFDRTRSVEDIDTGVEE
jgi:hypothetical protein